MPELITRFFPSQKDTAPVNRYEGFTSVTSGVNLFWNQRVEFAITWRGPLRHSWYGRDCRRLLFQRWLRQPTAPNRLSMPPCSGQSRPSPAGGRERRGQPWQALRAAAARI